MGWRDAVTAWTSLETRRPFAWRTGVFGLLGGTLAVALSEIGRLPRVPPAARWPLLAVLAVLTVLLGRRLFWNDGERRLRTLWRLIGLSLLIAGLSRAGRWAGLPLDQGALATGDAAAMVASGLSLLAVLTAACVVAVRLLDRRPVRELGIVPGPGFWGDLGFGLGLGAFLMTLVFGVQIAAGWIEIVDLARPGRGAASFATGFVSMTLLFAAVGFYEELVNRGYLLRALAQGFVCRRIPPGGALAIATLLSSAVFGLGHAGNPHATWVSTFGIVLAGVMLALPYVLTGRLAASVGLHVTWNLFQGSVFGFPVSGLTAPATLLAIEQGGPELWTGGEFGPEAGLLGLLAMLLGAFLIVGRERRRGGAVLQAALAAVPAPGPGPSAPAAAGPVSA